MRRLAAQVISLAAILLVVGGCANERTTAIPSPVESVAGSPCPAPALTPGYLPDGVQPADVDPIFGSPERVRTWTKDSTLVQLGEGFSGDHGDEPRLRQVNVRGTDQARLLAHKDPRDGTPVVSVDWDETTRCGFKQYIVVTKGVSEEETLRIANSLEGDTT